MTRVTHRVSDRRADTIALRDLASSAPGGIRAWCCNSERNEPRLGGFGPEVRPRGYEAGSVELQRIRSPVRPPAASYVQVQGFLAEKAMPATEYSVQFWPK